VCGGVAMFVIRVPQALWAVVALQISDPFSDRLDTLGPI